MLPAAASIDLLDLLQAFKLQPRYGADLANVVPTIVANIADVQQACSSAVQSLQASPSGVTLSGLTGTILIILVLAVLCPHLKQHRFWATTEKYVVCSLVHPRTKGQ